MPKERGRIRDHNLFALNLLACVAIGTARVMGRTDNLFKDAAHLYVASLFTYGYSRLKPYDCLGLDYCFHARDLRFWRLAWLLSVVELVTALYQRGYF